MKRCNFVKKDIVKMCDHNAVKIYEYVQDGYLTNARVTGDQERALVVIMYPSARHIAARSFVANPSPQPE